MGESPSMDEILSAGRKRQKRLELGLGVTLLLGGGVWLFAMNLTHAPGGGLDYMSYGVLGMGGLLVARGLFGSGRGHELPVPAEAEHISGR